MLISVQDTTKVLFRPSDFSTGQPARGHARVLGTQSWPHWLCFTWRRSARRYARQLFDRYSQGIRILNAGRLLDQADTDVVAFIAVDDVFKMFRALAGLVR